MFYEALYDCNQFLTPNRFNLSNSGVGTQKSIGSVIHRVFVRRGIYSEKSCLFRLKSPLFSKVHRPLPRRLSGVPYSPEKRVSPRHKDQSNWGTREQLELTLYSSNDQTNKSIEGGPKLLIFGTI